MKRLVVHEIQVAQNKPEHCDTKCPWYEKWETLRTVQGVGAHSCKMFNTWRSALRGPPLRAPECIAGESRAQDLGLKQQEEPGPQGTCHRCFGPLSWSPQGIYCHSCEGDDSGGSTT